jgi:Fur family transcriptional regulator, ferric uptake regulator
LYGGKRSDEVSVTAEDIWSAFERAGLRNTHPRRVIADKLAELAQSGAEFATEDLWRVLQDEDPGLGRATVFRAVETLLDQGVLDRVAFADGTHRYRVCGAGGEPHHHHHLTCVACRRVVEVDACLSPDMLAAIGQRTGFSLEGHAVELFGRCPSCRAGSSTTL